MQRLIPLFILLLIIFSCSKKNTINTLKKVESNANTQLQQKYANILDVETSTIQNTQLYAFIDDWMGIKYQYGGISKSGVDCSGFCYILYNQVYDKELPRTTSEIAKKIKKVDKTKLEEGDLVFFNISNKRNSHVGVYLQNNKFVHASTSKGVIISSLENPYYKKYYHKGGKVL